MLARATVLADVESILQELLEDWEFEGAISEQSRILGDLGLESIDAVALGTALEEKYQQTLPFAHFLSRLQRSDQEETEPGPDFTVGEIVDFVLESLGASAPVRA